MIVPDIFKNGKWLRCVGSGENRCTTQAGAYYAELCRRCCPKQQLGKYKTYAGCTNQFKDFQDFASWAVTQIGYGYSLDKDIIVKGNKVYSKDTCAFVPTELNNLLTRCDARRGSNPIGVSYDPIRGYKVCVNKEKVNVFLGYCANKDDAFSLYKKHKESFIKQQAEKWKSQIDPRAYNALMNYQVEITD